MKSQIKNILFDLGGVLLDIDYLKTVEAFRKLGLEKPEKAFTKEIQADLFQRFECGKISDDEFLNVLKAHMPQASRNEIIEAWNALLGNFPEERYRFVLALKDNFRLGVLSNTNAIHEREFINIIDRSVGWKNFESLCQGLGYSHQLGQRKPNSEVFQMCLKNLGFKPGETLFIDDTEEHVNGALKAGLKAIHLQSGTVENLLKKELEI